MEIIKVFCDISGTYTSNDLNNRELLVKEFARALDYIAHKKNAIIKFSFLSDLDCEAMKEFINELQKHLSSNIVLGKQYGTDGYIDEGEIHQQSSLIKPLQIMQDVAASSSTNDVKEVYYFDDAAMYTEMFDEEISSDIGAPCFTYKVSGGLDDLIKYLSSFENKEDYSTEGAGISL